MSAGSAKTTNFVDEADCGTVGCTLNIRLTIGSMSYKLILGNIRRFSAFKDAFISVFKSNPRFANALTGCVTFSMGDILAQKLEAKSSNKENGIDFWRSLQVGLLGVIMNGFCLHYWYLSLDKVIGASMTNKIGIASKVLADQTIYAPFAIVSFFYFASLRTTNEVSLANAKFWEKMDVGFVKTFLADCVIWPMSNYVNFRYIPLPYRPSFTAVIQLMWQTYMSLTSHNDAPSSGQHIPTVNSTEQFVRQDQTLD